MDNKTNIFLINKMKQKLLQGKVVVGTGASDSHSVDIAICPAKASWNIIMSPVATFIL